MRKYTLIYLFFQVIFLFASDTTKILLIHPTVNNITTFQYLIKNKQINIEKIQFIGVYQKDELYDYSQSKQFIIDSNLTNFKIYEISQEINQNDIFKENKLSEKFDSLFSISDGAVFMGGDDISPAVYGAKTNFLTEIDDPYRHYFELSFLYHLLNKDAGKNALLNKNPNYVILGICLGMQTINVACGGSMYQDIPTEIYKLKDIESATKIQSKMHKNYVKRISDDKTLLGASIHPVKLITENNSIKSLFSENSNPYVLSWHHQAVKKLGNNLNIIFKSEDEKVIEGISHTKFKNVYGFQFHPEYLKIYKNESVRFNENEPENGFGDILKSKKSYKFHLEIWQFFSEQFN